MDNLEDIRRFGNEVRVKGADVTVNVGKPLETSGEVAVPCGLDFPVDPDAEPTDGDQAMAQFLLTLVRTEDKDKKKENAQTHRGDPGA